MNEQDSEDADSIILYETYIWGTEVRTPIYEFGNGGGHDSAMTIVILLCKTQLMVKFRSQFREVCA